MKPTPAARPLETAQHAPSEDAPRQRWPGARVLAVNVDPAVLGLLAEWLGPADCEVMDEAGRAEGWREPPDLVIVDIPLPRHGGLDVLRRAAADYCGVPIVAMSSSFFADVKSHGGLARTLGVAGVLPKPLTRDAVMTVVRRGLARVE